MILKLDFLEIIVQDLNQAIEWYKKVLELYPEGEVVSNEEGRWVRLCSNSGDDVIALWEAQIKPTDETKINSNFVPVFITNDLVSDVERIKELGFVFEEGIREREQYRITTIKDCSGNLIQLYESK